MFGRKETTAEKVAGQLGVIEKVRAANSRYQNPYSTTLDEPEKKIFLNNRADQIDYFMRKPKYRGFCYYYTKNDDNKPIDLSESVKRLSLEEFGIDGYCTEDAKKIAKETVDNITGDFFIRKPALSKKSTRIGSFFAWAAVTAAAVGVSFAAEGAAHHSKVLPTNQKPLTTITVAAGAFLSPVVQYSIAAGQGAIHLGLAGATAAVAGGLFKKARGKNGLLDPQELSTALANFYLSSDSAGDNTKFVTAGRQVIRNLFSVTGVNTIAELLASAKFIKELSLDPDLAPQNPEYLNLAEQIRIATVNALTCLLCLENQHLSSFLKDIVGTNAAGYRNMILEAAEGIPEVEEWLSVNLCANNSDTWSSIKAAIQEGNQLSEAQRTCLLMLPTKGGLQYSPGLAVDLLPLGNGQPPVRSAISPAAVAAASRSPR
jgi:hypothetical protein